ncbi:hypothetical protein KR026_005393 [Drosophila bipectinata]|nr:hypothetical protein KR026_005393 [Drosophila bipectinata]
MSLNGSIFDVEERLDNFIVRKNSKKRDFSKTGPTVHDNVPLTLGHLQRVTNCPEREKVFLTANKRVDDINFSTCMVYALVVGHGTHNNAFYKYIIDDGTGFLEASFPKNTAKRTAMAGLANEAQAVGSYDKYKDISSCLLRILGAVNEYTDPTQIKRGDYVCLRGKPNIFRGSVGLDVFSFVTDQNKCRELEIGFADHLIEWHDKVKPNS